MKKNSKNITQENSSVSIIDALDKKATQVAFAQLVGITQPAVNKHVGQCLQKGQSLRVWLHAYCEHLRNTAAGRGGDDQATLTQARIAESEAKTALNRIAYHEKIKTLVLASEGGRVLTEWAEYAKQTFENTFDEFRHEIESKYSIQVDDGMCVDITAKSLASVGKYAEKLAESLTSEDNNKKGV